MISERALRLKIRSGCLFAQDDHKALNMASTFHPFDPVRIVRYQPLKNVEETAWEGFTLDKSLQTDVFTLPNVEEKHLQELEPGIFSLQIDDVPIESLEVSSASSYTTAEEESARDAEQAQTDTEQEAWENIWTFPEVKDTLNEVKLTSWDHFTNTQHVEQSTAYLSEVVADTFDAIVAVTSKTQQTAALVLSDVLLRSLYSLGLGRSSLLFQWDDKQHTFTRPLETFTISGCTPALVDDIVSTMISSGTAMRKLASSGQLLHNKASATNIALASAIRSCLAAIEQYMDEQRLSITSFLQLQQMHSPVRGLIQLLTEIVHMKKVCSTDTAFLESLVRAADQLALRYQQFRHVRNHVLSAVAQPLLLSMEILAAPGSVSTNSPEQLKEALSSLLSVDIAHKLQETMLMQTLLHEHRPERLAAFGRDSPCAGSRLAFTWRELLQLQIEADHYENRVRSACVAIDARTHANFRQSLASEISASHDATISPFECRQLDLFADALDPVDKLAQLNVHCLKDVLLHSDLAIEYQEVLPLSISPMLFARHRLLSYTMLSTLVTQHQLRSHLSLQHQIHLLGDGMFAARLDATLFDPDQSSGEGHRKISTTAGLRLQARDGWPPASSELRLVLMGVLSESLKGSGLAHLEDTISFAIRELSDEDVEKCRDVDSIHALDFLKLQYRPSNPLLEAVMSPESLEKYDRIFQHLLRVLRMKSVARSLLRDASNRHQHTTPFADHRFRIEVQRFILTLADYSQNIAVNRPWTVFESLISDIENKIDQQDYDGALQIGQSLENLKRRHEDTLDVILRGLLLKRKQIKILENVEEIFGVILRYAAMLRKARSDTITMTEYRDAFRQNVCQFIVLLRGSEADNRKETQVGNTDFLHELATMIDYNGYWTR